MYKLLISNKENKSKLAQQHKSEKSKISRKVEHITELCMHTFKVLYCLKVIIIVSEQYHLYLNYDKYITNSQL